MYYERNDLKITIKADGELESIRNIRQDEVNKKLERPIFVYPYSIKISLRPGRAIPVLFNNNIWLISIVQFSREITSRTL